MRHALNNYLFSHKLKNYNLYPDDSSFNVTIFFIYSYTIRLPTGSKTLLVSAPTEWLHMVIIVEGEDTVIIVYHNKVEKTGSLTSNPGHFLPGSGTTIIGKFGIFFSTVTVDELAMWNRALSPAEVAQLYDMMSE